jgi:hypothetical protein
MLERGRQGLIGKYREISCQSGISITTSKERGEKTCIICPKLQKIYKIIMESF